MRHLHLQTGGANAHRILRNRQTSLRAAVETARRKDPAHQEHPRKKQGFKLYERRNSLKNGLMINTLSPGFSQNCSGFSPRKPEILSRSILDFSSLFLSPMTPLNGDYLSQSTAAALPTMEEEKAIAEKKFYFHPSPRTTSSRNGEPQLLPQIITGFTTVQVYS
ncbi:hypothetical protein DH2020_022035 [Rehmannia glutinosa]|uniref:Uncharacterized protein n=1 Tax=Rehmannia glutinosa TaxID=99300 RepID=A0ABR0WGF5_REHGL